MTNSLENSLIYLKRYYGVSGILIVASLLSGCGLLPQPAGQEAEMPTPAGTPTLIEPTATEILPPATHTPLPVPGDRTHPYTKILYQRAPQPNGYEGWDCLSIPVGGTSFGAILVGGASTTTRYDSSAAVVFVDGVDKPPVIVDLTTPPETWDSVELVQPGTVACSK